VIGSNLFNILAILGVTAVITPLAVAPAMLDSDLWWMLSITLMLFPIMRSRTVVTRVEGALLILIYGTYVTLLALAQ
jgi:cation:H+ antiporter